MRPVHSTTVFVTLLCACSIGCEPDKKAPDAPPSATAALAPDPVPTPPPVPKEPPKPSRPETITLEVTPERRAKIESAFPEAKGFLVMQALEDKLKALKTLKDKDPAVKAFDHLASGKWVLFTGPLANPADSKFDLGITYTPQIKGDMMGMSRQFFLVTFPDVKGYQMADFKPGQMVVVLAKYEGKQKASSGTELVAAGDW